MAAPSDVAAAVLALISRVGISNSGKRHKVPIWSRAQLKSMGGFEEGRRFVGREGDDASFSYLCWLLNVYLPNASHAQR
jgi:hypothetical protein